MAGQALHIGWCTPCNVESAIARYSCEVVGELRRRGHRVSVVRSEVGEARQLPLLEELASLPLDDGARLVQEADVLVVNVADHFELNGGSLALLEAHPCVGVFHDADVRNLLTGWAIESRHDIDAIRNWNTHDFGLGMDPPWLASLCAGAVVHGGHYEAAIGDACPGPTLRVPLCLGDTGQARRDRRPGEFALLTFGYLNANKQADRVLRAVAASGRLRDRTTYHLAGHIVPAEKERLTALAEELGIAAPVFHGYVADDELGRLLDAANAVSCLRHPIVEGGSASLIQSLYSANPVIVGDGGSYADVPDDLVYKVSCGTEVADLTAAIEAIDADQRAADDRGTAARDWALATYSTTLYVDALVPHLRRCIALAPALDAARLIGTTVSDLGLNHEDPLFERLGQTMDGLFPSGVDPVADDAATAHPPAEPEPGQLT